MSGTAGVKEYKNRTADHLIEAYLKLGGAVCVEGLRSCGKTTTAKRHAKSAFFVEDPQNGHSNRQLAELEPALILRGDAPRLIDEYQTVPEIEGAVLDEVGKRQKAGQFILTASSSPLTENGGIARIRMQTMSLYESGDSSGAVSLKDLCEGVFEEQTVKETGLEELLYYIVRGGFPENISAAPEKAHLMPRAYVEDVIGSDVNGLDGGAEYDVGKVRALLKSLAKNESTAAPDAAVLKGVSANGVSLSRVTAAKYMSALKRLFLFNDLATFSPYSGAGGRVKQAEKRHFSDPSIPAALLNMTGVQLLGDINTVKALFETLAVRDLCVYAQSFGAKVFRSLDYKNNETDAVIELADGEWCAFDIALGARRIDEGAANLNKVCADIIKNGGKAPRVKCVICGISNAAYKRSDGVYVVPLTALKN